MRQRIYLTRQGPGSISHNINSIVLLPIFEIITYTFMNAHVGRVDMGVYAVCAASGSL